MGRGVFTREDESVLTRYSSFGNQRAWTWDALCLLGYVVRPWLGCGMVGDVIEHESGVEPHALHVGKEEHRTVFRYSALT